MRFLICGSYWTPVGSMLGGFVPPEWLGEAMPEMAAWLVEAGIESYVLQAEKTGDFDYHGSAECRIFITYPDDLSAVAHRMRW